MMKGIAVILIILGIAALLFQGFTYTTREKVLEVGPLEATAEKKKTVSFPPILGVISLTGGIVLLVAAIKRPS